MSKKMSEQNKISVIVPVFRVEKYLSRCVDSILGQTYKNIEVILVDDGSDDACPSICDHYAELDKRIRVVHRENGGLSAARNSGIAVSTGDIISLVDSDDYINMNMFADMMKELVEKDADIVMCDYKYAYIDGVDDQIKDQSRNAVITVTDGRSAQYKVAESYETRVTYTVAWNKLYRRELFDGITYPEGRIHEDEARTNRLLYRAKKIVYIEYPYYYYFQRKDSIIGKKVSKANLQLLDAYLDKLSFFREQNEKELWSIEAIHAMHMTCYLKQRFEEAKSDIKIRKEPQWEKLCNELGFYSIAGILNSTQKAEVCFFMKCPAIYYLAWKKFKK